VTDPDLTASARRVAAALEELGMSGRVVELPDSARTAPEAARAIGCRVDQIVKSLVFRGTLTGNPVLVLVGGALRVDEARLAELLGEPVAMADADFVRDRTGFAIGGVPPVGHSAALDALIDTGLLEEEVVWAAGGTPHAVFPLTPEELQRATGGRVVTLAAAAP
jgi:prolyl-tRNA editing enzyme YbaK/EbsC (Cys-tRNA(Pro) deacylase)